MEQFKIKGRVLEEKDFWLTIRLRESGMIIDLMKKDLEVVYEKESADG